MCESMKAILDKLGRNEPHLIGSDETLTRNKVEDVLYQLLCQKHAKPALGSMRAVASASGVSGCLGGFAGAGFAAFADSLEGYDSNIFKRMLLEKDLIDLTMLNISREEKLSPRKYGYLTNLLAELNQTELLILVLKASPDLMNFFDSELKPFWLEKFRSVGNEVGAGFQFREQSIISPLKYFAGVQAYFHSLKFEKMYQETELQRSVLPRQQEALNTGLQYRASRQKEISNALLEKASQGFGCFHAYRHLYATKIELHAHSKCDGVDLLEGLRIDMKSFMKYKTPGCLLIAEIYLALANLSLSKGEGGECLIAHLKKAYHYIILATLLEPLSEQEIFNAYYGRGYMLSNGYKLNSLEEMKQMLLSTHRWAFTEATLDNIDKEARDQANKLVIKILELEPESGKRALGTSYADDLDDLDDSDAKDADDCSVRAGNPTSAISF